MKTSRIKTLAQMTGLGIALALLAGVAGEVKAQEKGGERLLKLNAAPKPALAPAQQAGMSCPKCKDVFTTQSDLTPRGLGARTLVAGGAPTQTVARHLCDGCSVEWIITGHGKAKEAVAIHKCASCEAKNLASVTTR